MEQTMATSAPAPKRELTPQQRKAQTISNMLLSRKDAIQALLPRHLPAEKMIRGVMAAATRSPKILECTPLSILNCVLISASLGLEIGRPRGGMYLVPFKNKKNGTMEATPIPDYRGLMDLAFRSGMVTGIEARTVYSGDVFDFSYGTDSHIKHVPALPRKGEIKCVYAVAHLKDARPSFVVLSKEEIEEHRGRSRARNDGPWVTDWTAMALKTAVKVLSNWLPQAAELDLLAKAVEADERIERGESVVDMFDVIEGHSEDMGSTDADKPDQPTRTESLKSKIQGEAPTPPETILQKAKAFLDRTAAEKGYEGLIHEWTSEDGGFQDYGPDLNEAEMAEIKAHYADLCREVELKRRKVK